MRKSLGRRFLKIATTIQLLLGFDLSVLHAGLCTHLRVGPLGFDLVGHLLGVAQQVITLHALQVEETKTHSSESWVARMTRGHIEDVLSSLILL